MAFDEAELRKFSAAGRTIAAAVGASVEQWARAEAGVILKTWAGKTPLRKDRALEVSGLMRANRAAKKAAGFGVDRGRVRPGQASVNLGLRGPAGRVYYRTRKKGADGGRAGFQDAFSSGFGRGKHIRNQDWPAVGSFVSTYRELSVTMVAAAKRAGGLAIQSIVQIADDLGIKLEEVKGGGRLSVDKLSSAKAALASNRQYYRNGYAVEQKTATDFHLTLVNGYPKAPALFMDQTLRGVISGRLKYFQRNLEEGTFLSAERAARAYPYVAVLRDAA